MFHLLVRRSSLPLFLLLALVVLLWMIAAWRRLPIQQTTFAPGRTVQPVNVDQQRLSPALYCTGQFVSHQLPFATGARLRTIHTYESNGAGVAVNDLDNDSDLDLVFASIDGPSEILWNTGSLQFSEEPLDDLYTRAVALVDVDGDARLDILFTHRSLETVAFWRNQGNVAGKPHFQRSPLPNVTQYAHSMGWADLNGDQQLDLVTAAYTVDLQSHDLSEALLRKHTGVIYHERAGDGFVVHLLASQSEGLAIGLVDLNHDAYLDIWVANDFALQDHISFYNPQNGEQPRQPLWLPARPFAETSFSTMSLDWGDIENNGQLALFTTDMNPYDISTATQAAWLPVMKALEQTHPHQTGDPQQMANTLQIVEAPGQWRNAAALRGVDATGWSWAGKWGDLDSDGFLDLYVVNGMIAQNLFGHLPYAELVEENQVFRNRGDGHFAPAPTWGLNATASGRGMVMADLDNDGDLDVVVSNLRQAAQLWENQLCSGANLLVDLRWLASANTYAIGAHVALYTSHGIYRRDVRASGGYLSTDTSRLHFGFPTTATLEKLEVRWPDGQLSQVTGLEPQTLLTVSR